MSVMPFQFFYSAIVVLYQPPVAGQDEIDLQAGDFVQTGQVMF
jgi:hypothetical protein